MAVTLYDMRQKAPTPPLAMALETVMRTEPLLNEMLWDSTAMDRQPYRRARGAATVAHFNPDSTMTDGTDESFDEMTAYIRPIGGHIQMPVIGSNSGSLTDHIRAKTRAVVWQYMNTLINGGFGICTCASCAVLTDGVAGSTGSIVPGPYFDLSTRGSHITIKLVIVNGVSFNASIRASGDTTYGTATGVIAAGADATYTLYSANPNYWVTMYADNSDLVALATGTYEYDVLITSTTNAFDGLIKLVTNTTSYVNTPTAAAEAFDLGHLDLLKQTVKTGGKRVFLMAERTERAFLAEMRGLGGVTYTEIASKQVPTYNGIPVLTSSYVPITRTYAGVATCAPIFLLDLEEGIRGLFRSGNGTAEYDGKSYAGLRVTNLGEVITNAENELIRLTAHWGVEHLNLPGAAMLDGITN